MTRHFRLMAAALLLLSLSCVRAMASDVTFLVIVDPEDDAGQLNERVGFSDIPLTSSFSNTGTIVRIPVPESASQQQHVPLTLYWKDGTPGDVKSTTFPIVLVSSFAGHIIDVDFDAKDVPADLDINVIRRACLQNAPQAIADMFAMFYTCGAYARELEDNDKQWEPADRTAIEGWLIANFALFNLGGGNLSPYGVDDDLLARLRDAIAISQKYGEAKLSPINLSDAKQLVNAVDQQSIRLVSTVGPLIQSGQLVEAQRINKAALQQYDALKTTKPVFGVTRSVLLGNQALIATKLQQQ